ncbi:putative proton-dependent oligopeptide transporter family [Helianthus anomalus]
MCSPYLFREIFRPLGGQRPCIQDFGEFDANHLEELKSKSSFFNWWIFLSCATPTIGIFV